MGLPSDGSMRRADSEDCLLSDCSTLVPVTYGSEAGQEVTTGSRHLPCNSQRRQSNEQRTLAVARQAFAVHQHSNDGRKLLFESLPLIFPCKALSPIEAARGPRRWNDALQPLTDWNPLARPASDVALHTRISW